MYYTYDISYVLLALWGNNMSISARTTILSVSPQLL